MQSHQRAAKATAEGYFKEQILPIELKSRKGTVTFDTDEHIRADATMEGMAKLRPVFDKSGSVTAGNAAGINDAAAAVVLCDAETAERKGLEPMGRLVAYAHAGVEPKYMGIGPVPAVRTVPRRPTSRSTTSRPFAAQALAVVRDSASPRTAPTPTARGCRWAIGATGCILTVKALYELKRTGGRRALVTMCIGGGQGIAAIFERWRQEPSARLWTARSQFPQGAGVGGRVAGCNGLSSAAPSSRPAGSPAGWLSWDAARGVGDGG